MEAYAATHVLGNGSPAHVQRALHAVQRCCAVAPTLCPRSRARIHHLLFLLFHLFFLLLLHATLSRSLPDAVRGTRNCFRPASIAVLPHDPGEGALGSLWLVEGASQQGFHQVGSNEAQLLGEEANAADRVRGMEAMGRTTNSAGASGGNAPAWVAHKRGPMQHFPHPPREHAGNLASRRKGRGRK